MFHVERRVPRGIANLPLLAPTMRRVMLTPAIGLAVGYGVLLNEIKEFSDQRTN